MDGSELDYRSDAFAEGVAGMVRRLLPLESRVDAFWDLAATCHGLALRSGWWTNPETGEPARRSTIQLLMLCISEVAEAMEGDRKGLKDDHLPHRDMREVEIADCLIRLFDAVGGMEVHAEMVECALTEIGPMEWDKITTDLPFSHMLYHGCTLLSSYPEVPFESVAAKSVIYFAAAGAYFEMDLGGAVADKLKYNQERQDHKLAERAKAGGKAY